MSKDQKVRSRFWCEWTFKVLLIYKTALEKKWEEEEDASIVDFYYILGVGRKEQNNVIALFQDNSHKHSCILKYFLEFYQAVYFGF